MESIRILFLADTHLGIDQPVNPRIQRRRRGDDFMANYRRVLNHGAAGRCDAIVHGGDVFYRSKVRPGLVQSAFAPLKHLADRGLPVFVVPGNHERSRIPHAMLAIHPRIHIFDRPRTFTVSIRGVRLAFIGFPYARSVRGSFPTLLAQTDWQNTCADVRLLCVHHCFEGATVGPGNFTFRFAEDVIRHVDVPEQIDAVLTGHIHRHQILLHDLRGRRLRTPVWYPGSIERTSFAERDEPKGFLMVTLTRDASGRLSATPTFRRLPARPMISVQLHPEPTVRAFRDSVERVLRDAPRDAIVRLALPANLTGAFARTVSAESIRSMSPDSMTVEVRRWTAQMARSHLARHHM